MSFAELAALKSGADDASDSFVAWFQWQRVFQVNTWGHVALGALLIVVDALPILLAFLRKLGRLFSGTRTPVGELPTPCTPLTFVQAATAGVFQVRVRLRQDALPTCEPGGWRPARATRCPGCAGREQELQCL